MPDTKSYTEFSKAIKEKYPEYKDVGDYVLSKRIIEKYPQYKDRVSFDDSKPSTFDAGHGIIGKVDEYGDTSYVHPGGVATSELPAAVTQNNTPSAETPSNYVEQSQAQPSTGNFWENFGNEFKRSWQDDKYIFGNVSNIVTGSQKDATKALQLLDDYEKAGVDYKKMTPNEMMLQKYNKDYAEWEKRHPGFFDKLWHYLPFVEDSAPDYPTSAGSANALATSSDASKFDKFLAAIGGSKPYDYGLQTSNNVLSESDKNPYKILSEAANTENPRAYLEKKAKQQSWGDKVQADAVENLSKIPEGKGAGGILGGLAANTVPFAVAGVASLTPYTRWTAPILTKATVGQMVISSAAEAGMQARQYAEQKGIDMPDSEVDKIMAISGGVNWLAMHIPVERFMSGASKLLSKNVTRKVVDELVSNPAAMKEAGEFFDAARPLVKTFSKQAAGKLGKDVAVGAAAGTVINTSNEIIPLLYKNKEDYPNLWDVVKNGLQGAGAGVLMSAFLGGENILVNNFAQNARRMKAGNVTLADAGKHGIVEVLGGDANNYTVLNNKGEQINIPKSEVNENSAHTVPYKEFKEYARSSGDENAQQAFKNLTNGEKRIISDNYFNAFDALNESMRGRGITFDIDKILNSSKQQQQQIIDLTKTALDLTREQKNAIIDFIQKGNIYNAMQRANDVKIEDAAEGAINTIKKNVNPDMGGVVKATVAGADRQIIQGKIVPNEDGTINREQSDQQIFYKDENGKVQVAPIDNIEGIVEHIPQGDAVNQAVDITTKPIINQHANETDPFIGKKIELPSGIGNMEINWLNQDGTYNINLTLKNGKAENVDVTIDELKQIIDPTNSKQNESPTTGETNQTTGNDSAQPVKQTENDVNVSNEQSAEKPVSSIEEITARAPKQKNGKVDYNALMEQSPEDYATLMEQRIGTEETKAEFINDSKNLQTEIDKRKEKLSKETDRNKKEDLRDEINDLTKRKQTIDGIIQSRYDTKNNSEALSNSVIPVDKSNSTRSVSTTPELKNEKLSNLPPLSKTPAQSVSTSSSHKGNKKISKTKKLTAIQQSLKNFNRDEQNLRGKILHDIASGRVKFRWGDVTSQEGTVLSPGLKNSLFATRTNANEERKAYFSLLSNSGLTPEQYAHQLWQENPEGLDSHDVLNEVLDVLQSTNSRKAALESLEKPIRNEEEYYKGMQDALDSEKQNEPKQTNDNVNKNFISEYDSQPLTRVEGLGMGQNQAKGVYVSFEPNNRYETENNKAKQVEISLQNPIEFDQNKDEFAKFQRQILENRLDDFKVSDFSSINEGEIPTIDNLNENGIERLSGFVTEELQNQGHGGIVFNGDGEHEIVIFDKNNVREKEIAEHPEKSVQEQLNDVGGNVLAHAANVVKKAEIKSEEGNVNTNPSEAQKEAGNYKMGHVNVQGFDVTIEQPKGSVRSGMDENGNSWSQEMQHTYGYIRGTKGKDGDHIDVFLGDNLTSDKVFVVDQLNPNTGEFDEHKVMMGFNSIDDARKAYLSNYEDGWKGLGNVTETNVENFSKWAAMDGRRIKPFADYKVNQPEETRDDFFAPYSEDEPVPFQFIGEKGVELEAVNNRFNEELQQQLDGTLPNRHIYKLGNPSEALLSSLDNMPIEMAASTLELKSGNNNKHEHPFDKSEIKDLPKALAHPIAVFESETNPNRTVVLTELKDSKGNNFIAIIDVKKERGRNIIDKVNSIISLYPKDSNVHIAKWFLGGKEKSIGRDLLKWVDSKKALNWLSNNVTSVHSVGLSTKSIAKVIRYFENPKLSEQKNDFTPASKEKFDALIEKLKQNGLASDVITDKSDYDKEFNEVSQQLKHKSGTVYGFVKDGKVYLDPIKMNYNTPIHEFGHLWNKFIKETNPELWNKGVELIKQSDYWKKVNENPAYKNNSEEQKIDEAIAWVIGDKGETQQKGKDVLSFARLKNWLNDVWKWIKGKFGFDSKLDIENMTLDDFTNKAVKDLTGDKELKGEENLESQAKNNNFAENNIVNKNGEINYDELYKQSDRIRKGYAHINVLSPAEESGRNAGGRRNVEATLLLRGEIGADGSQQSNTSGGLEESRGNTRELSSSERSVRISNEKSKQEGILKEYAKHEGIWILPETIEQWKLITDEVTMESRVYDDGDNVIKVGFNYLNYYDTPLDWLTNKISLHNYLFPETKLELIGFTETYGATKNVPGTFFAPVYRQKYIRGKVLENNSDYSLIKAEMKRKGYSWTGFTSFYNDNYVIKDLHLNNVMIDENGKFIFFDTVPFLNIKANKGIGGTREYGDYSIVNKNLENSEKNTNFVQQQNINSDGKTKAGMDYGRTMGSSSLRKLVGESEQSRRILETLEASNRSGSGSPTEASGRSTWDKEHLLRRLESEAKKNETWINDIHEIADKALSKGQENEVYLSQDGENVIKVNNLSIAKEENTLDDFIDRLSAHNELFPNVPYRIIGFTENSLGETSFVLEQPFINNVTHPTQDEINSFMKSNGFVMGEYDDEWHNKDYVLWDVDPKNVLKDREGNLYFIDTVINHTNNTSELSSGDVMFQAVPNEEKSQYDEKPQYKGNILEFARRMNEWYDKQQSKKGNNTVGISHDALNDLANRIGLPPLERGGSYDPKELADRGRKLLRAGANLKQIEDEFYQDGITDENGISVIRAHIEDLYKTVNSIQDKNNIRFKNAFDELSRYTQIEKDMANKAHRIFKAFQGQRDIDTDSFSYNVLAVESKTGKSITEEQRAKIEELTNQTENYKKQISDYEKKLVEALDKEHHKIEKSKPSQYEKPEFTGDILDYAQRLNEWNEKQKSQEKNNPSNRKNTVLQGKSLADKIRKAKIHRPGSFYSATPASLAWDGGVEIVAKTVESGARLADAIRQGVNYIKGTDWYNNLTAERQDKAEEDFINWHNDQSGLTDLQSRFVKNESVNINRLEKQLSDLQNDIVKQKNPSRELSEREKELKQQIRNEKIRLGLIEAKPEKVKLTPEQEVEQRKKDLKDGLKDYHGNKFTSEDAKAIWDYMKQNYLNNGTPYSDAVSYVADDLGLTHTQVNNAIVTPKTKPLSDDVWKTNRELSRNRAFTKRWIDEQSHSIVYRNIKKATDMFREVAVFGHGGIFVGTHAMPTIFDLPRAKHTVKALLDAYKFAYGNTADYELIMRDLKNSSNYIKAQRAGLQNDPDRLGSDSEIASNWFKKWSTAGERGFNAIKVLRQALFDAHYDQLPAEAREDPDVLKSIAQIINTATGGTNAKMSEKIRDITFAGGMEVSRWERIVKNPLKTLGILSKWNRATTAEKVFAKLWAKRAGTIAAAYLAALAINDALNYYFFGDDKHKINFYHPSQSDWMLFKIGSLTVSPTSGMQSTLRFATRLVRMAFESEKEMQKEYYSTNRIQALSKISGKYFQGKLAPGYSTALEQFTHHDYNGNVLPYIEDKPYNKYAHKMSYWEYLLSKAPLPIAEASQVYNQAIRNQGATDESVNAWWESAWFKAVEEGLISGTTGVRLYGNDKTEGKKYDSLPEYFKK